MDAYIEIDGKRAKLTEEQLKALGLEPEKKSAFQRCDGRQTYYFISGAGNICERYDNKNTENEKHYKAGNYCTDKELMEQRALHETLNRLLWRYSMEHGGDKIDWTNQRQMKWAVYYAHDDKQYAVAKMSVITYMGNVCFISEKVARDAIDKIIKPFIAELIAEHPEFVW